MNKARQLFVVVPYYNEANGMMATLRGLADQSDLDFSLVLVDNGSTDNSAEVVSTFVDSRPPFPVHRIEELEKGTGSASDTGFRWAIGRGASWIARTDADCVPHRDWICNIKRALCEEGLLFIAGKIRPRSDEQPMTRRRRAVLLFMIWLAENYGRICRRGPKFRYPYFLAPGNNLAIASNLYLQSRGFPRSAIEDVHEDRTLSENVRTLTSKAALRSDVIVFASARRVRAWGFFNTLRWYRNHGYRPNIIDVR